jgi:hypothetical protein
MRRNCVREVLASLLRRGTGQSWRLGSGLRSLPAILRSSSAGTWNFLACRA